MSEEVAEIFSKHIFSSKYEDLDKKTIKQLKVFLLDTVGVGIAGSTGSKLNELKKIAHTWSKGKNCTVLGTWDKYSRDAQHLLMHIKYTVLNLTVFMKEQLFTLWQLF